MLNDTKKKKRKICQLLEKGYRVIFVQVLLTLVRPVIHTLPKDLFWPFLIPRFMFSPCTFFYPLSMVRSQTNVLCNVYVKCIKTISCKKPCFDEKA